MSTASSGVRAKNMFQTFVSLVRKGRSSDISDRFMGVLRGLCSQRPGWSGTLNGYIRLLQRTQYNRAKEKEGRV